MTPPWTFLFVVALFVSAAPLASAAPVCVEGACAWVFSWHMGDCMDHSSTGGGLAYNIAIVNADVGPARVFGGLTTVCAHGSGEPSTDSTGIVAGGGADVDGFGGEFVQLWWVGHRIGQYEWCYTEVESSRGTTQLGCPAGRPPHIPPLLP